ARNESCSTVNASGDAREHDPSTGATSASSHVARPHTFTPLARSVSSSSWWTTRPLRTTTSPARSPASAATGPPPGAGSGPGSPQPAPGRGREASEIGLADAAVPPDPPAGRGPADPVELLGRRKTTLEEPVRPAERACGFRRERGHRAVSRPPLPYSARSGG